jgi:hypothetical protein
MEKTQMEGEVGSTLDKQKEALFFKEYNLKNELVCNTYSDQICKFLITSYQGNQYIMVVFEIGSSTILVDPM